MMGQLEEALTFYSRPGCSSQHVTLFCGEGVGGYYGIAGEGEDIRAYEVPFSKAISMVDEDTFDNAISIVGLQWLSRNHKSLRKRWT